MRTDHLIALLVVLVVVTFTPISSSVFELPKYLLFILVSAGVLLYFFSRTSREAIDLRKIPFLLPIAAFAGWVILSYLTNGEVQKLLFISPRMFETPAFFILLTVLYAVSYRVSERYSSRSITNSLIISSVIVGVYTLLQQIGIDPVKWSEGIFALDRSFSTLGNPVLLATFSAMILPVAIVLAVDKRSIRNRVLPLLAGSFLITSAYLSASRAGLFAMVLATLLLIVVTAVSLREKFLILLKLTGVMVLTAFVVLAVSGAFTGSSSDAPAVSERVASSLSASDPSGSSRLFIWKSTVRMIIDRPFVGYTARGFTNTWPSYRDPKEFALEREVRYYDHPHNFYLELAVMYGVPALLVFLTLLFDVLGRLIRLLNSLREADEIYRSSVMIKIGAFSGIFAFAVSVVFSFSSVTLWLCLVLLLVIFASGTGPASRSDALIRGVSGAQEISHVDLASPKLKRGLYTPPVIAIVLLAFIFLLVARWYLADVAYKKGQSLLVVQPFAAIENMDKAKRYDPFMPDYKIGYASALLRSAQALELGNGASGSDVNGTDVQDARQENIDLLRESGRGILQDVITSDHREYLAYVPLIEDLIETGELDEAQKLIDPLLELDELNFKAVYFQGWVNEERGNFSEALKDYERAHILQRQDLTPLKRSVIIYVQQKEWKKAEDMLELILSSSPDDKLARQYLELVRSRMKGDQ